MRAGRLRHLSLRLLRVCKEWREAAAGKPEPLGARKKRLIRRLAERPSLRISASQSRSYSVGLDDCAATAQQVDDQHDCCDDQQQVNQSTADMADQAEQPQHQKNDKDCPKHRVPPCLPSLYLCSICAARVGLRVELTR